MLTLHSNLPVCMMNSSSLSKFFTPFNAINLGRGFAYVFVAGAVVWAMVFAGKTFNLLVNGPEVKLVLTERAGHRFAPPSSLTKRTETKPSDKPVNPLFSPHDFKADDFALTAFPETLVVRYNEQNPLKRVALFFLGASEHDVLSLAAVLYFTVGSWLLLKLLVDVKIETPFTLVNAQRLRKLALLVLLLHLAKYPARLAVEALVPAFHAPGIIEPLGHYVRLNTETTLPGAEVGIMLAVIAAVYKRGVELSQEAELTI